jgi:hypothetical protein
VLNYLNSTRTLIRFGFHYIETLLKAQGRSLEGVLPGDTNNDLPHRKAPFLWALVIMVTSAPNALAICTAKVPTPPDAPLISTFCPG